MRLVLVSKSPRRRQLLAELGWPVEYRDVEVDEQVEPSWMSNEVAEHLACRKAAAFPVTEIGDDMVVVAADTVVVSGQQPLGKPKSHAEATAMLRRLSGQWHRVYTGVCLRSQQDSCSFTEQTNVLFRQLEEETISHYIDTFHPYDKAGAYGIQEWIGMVGIERIEGCYYNVMGLPTSRLYDILKKRFASRVSSPRSSI